METTVLLKELIHLQRVMDFVLQSSVDATEYGSYVEIVRYPGNEKLYQRQLTELQSIKRNSFTVHRRLTYLIDALK